MESMEAQRVHIVGAAGTGTTTLGRELANVWAVPHADVDDYFWEPTEPPYTTKRDRASRIELMRQVFLPRAAWVLSGSLMGWGDVLIPSFDAVIFLTLEPSSRLARLTDRERRRYGSRIEPGGDRETHLRDFLEWAAAYEDPDFGGRSLATHEAWLSQLSCPVLRLESSESADTLLATTLDWSTRPAP